MKFKFRSTVKQMNSELTAYYHLARRRDYFGVSWTESAIALCDAFFLAVRVVYPHLPEWVLRVLVVHDKTMVFIDEVGHLQVDHVHPFDVLRKEGRKRLWRRLRVPFFNWLKLFQITVAMYRYIKRDRARVAIAKEMPEGM